MSLRIALLVLIGACGGCSIIEPSQTPESMKLTYELELKSVETLARKFSQKSIDIHRESEVYSLVAIGTGAAAAMASLYDVSGNVIKGLVGGAALSTGWKAYQNPQEISNAYALASRALRCSINVTDALPEALPDGQDTKLQSLATPSFEGPLAAFSIQIGSFENEYKRVKKAAEIDNKTRARLLHRAMVDIVAKLNASIRARKRDASGLTPDSLISAIKTKNKQIDGVASQAAMLSSMALMYSAGIETSNRTPAAGMQGSAMKAAVASALADVLKILKVDESIFEECMTSTP